MVHEAVSVDGPPAYLENPIEHYTYRSLADYHARTGRYAALAAEEMARNGRRFHLTDLLVRPSWTFCKMYLFQQGFREGMHGLLLSALYGYYTFLKYATLWERERGAGKKGV